MRGRLWVSVFLMLLPCAPAWAQSGGDFEITRSTIDGGGSTERSEDNLVIRGTIGQPDAGASGFGMYYLTGGFWATQGRLGIFFLDGFESGDTSAWSATVGENRSEGNSGAPLVTGPPEAVTGTPVASREKVEFVERPANPESGP